MGVHCQGRAGCCGTGCPTKDSSKEPNSPPHSPFLVPWDGGPGSQCLDQANAAHSPCLPWSWVQGCILGLQWIWEEGNTLCPPARAGVQDGAAGAGPGHLAGAGAGLGL